MRKRKDFLNTAIVLGVLMSVSTGINTLAATNETVENVGLSTQVPSTEVSLERGTKVPTAEWHSSNGKYEFSGGAESSTLYTNVYLTGDTYYDVSVKNEKSTKLTVKAFKKQFGADVAISNTTISGNSWKSFSTPAVKKSDKVYLAFYAPSKFSGTIQ